MKIFKEFMFEAAHSLPNVGLGHKCGQIHGHSFRVHVEISGELENWHGWVMDFAVLKDAWNLLDTVLDHHYLNDIPGLENPTSEHLCMWVVRHLHLPIGITLTKVVVQETCTTGAIWEKGDPV